MSPDSGEGTIKISKRDLASETLVCINLVKGIWIKRGFPMNKDTGIVDKKLMRNLSGPPYVFKADLLDLYDNKHPQGVKLNDVQVIFMHGGRKDDGS